MHFVDGVFEDQRKFCVIVRRYAYTLQLHIHINIGGVYTRLGSSCA